MSVHILLALVAANLGLIFLLMAAPLGFRTIRLSRVVGAPPERIWSALYPLAENAGWSDEIMSATLLGEDADGVRARLELSWRGRDDGQIERIVRLSEVEPVRRFTLRVSDDSSLERAFWKHYREEVEIGPQDSGTLVSITRTDRYRGAAFLIFRYFATRRELSKLGIWARTGTYAKGGLFEHPLTQVGFAALSALALWPLFGLNAGGLAMSGILTAVVALHELGHMAAFRLMGHRHVRMIFIPLLGGIAIGGRPYDSRFEVAFVALMGAGFSAFLVPIAMAASMALREANLLGAAVLVATLAGMCSLFNIANLVPAWKFDGGQVLRQICGGQLSLSLAAFALLSALLAIGHLAGVPWMWLLFSGTIFALLSLSTGRGGVKPRHALKPIGGFERAAIAAALVAVFAIHGIGVLWASALLV